MIKSNKTIEKDAFNQEVAIVQDIQEIRALNDKIKSLWMKVDLDLKKRFYSELTKIKFPCAQSLTTA